MPGESDTPPFEGQPDDPDLGSPQVLAAKQDGMLAAFAAPRDVPAIKPAMLT
ncbi:MAG: hypothetical protein JJ900_11760 [Rhodospirillales bacterium]|nr:hypothetical protein [Rhodospirillales bacterium]MBO6787517.1 hypothetical protein [Rhodospirillales bacterium]